MLSNSGGVAYVIEYQVQGVFLCIRMAIIATELLASV